MTLTPSELGALLALGFALFYYLRIFATLTAVIGLVSVVLLGTSGWLGRLLSDVTGLVVRLTNQLGANVFGGVVTGLLAVGLLIVYVHDLHPRHATGQRTAWLGVAIGALIVAGSTGIPALNGLHQGIVSAVTSVTSAL